MPGRARPLLFMDKHKALLHDVWRKANTLPDGISIPCPSEKDAQRLRASLYTSVKRVRAGTEAADFALQDAVANCTVGIDGPPGGKLTVVVRQKVMSALGQTVMAALGVTPDALPEVKTGEEVAGAESLARVMGKVESGEAVPDPFAAPNPYYNREG